MKNNKVFYKQRMPHVQPVGGTFFVTFRLAESIPKQVLRELNNNYELSIHEIKRQIKVSEREKKLNELRRIHFEAYDDLLVKMQSGPTYLKDERIAQIVVDQMKRFDGEWYDLLVYCLMSNHVHMLIDTAIQLPVVDRDEHQRNYVNLDRIMKQIKGSSARAANKHLGRTGQFWARESYDILIRSEKMLSNITSYILENPVKAGIVCDWRAYRWSYIKNYNRA